MPVSMPGHSRLPAEQRREQIIEIAIQLFSQKGFNGVTTREIAAAAGITEAIIFRHFETKDQLYKAVIDNVVDLSLMSQFHQQLQSLMEREDDEAVIRHLLQAIICSHKTNAKFERLMAYAVLESNEVALLHTRQVFAGMVEKFRQYFTRRQEQGHLRAIGPDAALMAVVGMAKHYAACRYIHGLHNEFLTDEQAVETFTQIALTGLRAPVTQRAEARKK